ncbi:transcriptional regulator, GntR family [Pseudorhodobacter antarcticus]|uniref:Transcriptional regulator, GntR family n=1 Tax=Pseudorhodobacter antarcticus TaxID=1077947 RepID=A0A1H8K9X2_9RHOB|nr:FCD domain-containing protein [Pseudorhodobacter antarcticus]SEN89306.1 transcriptional regulator, GntR family [Pseudorhodobacter antarcticus]
MTQSIEITNEAVKQKLLALIAAGNLGGDGKLPTERDLAEIFNVGRRNVRVALDALAREGLIWRKQGSGNYLGQPIDPTGALAEKITGQTNALEVMEARQCIEPELAALCAKRMKKHEMTQLQTLVDRQIASSDPDGIELWDSAFHRLIAQSAGNRPLLTASALLDKIRSNPHWITIRQTARSPASLQVTLREHQSIADAIFARNPVAARAAMQLHLSTRFDALRAQLAKMPEHKDNKFFDPEGKS